MSLNFPKLGDYEWVAPDTETTGLDWFRGDRPFSFAITLSNGYSEYYDIRKDLKAFHWAREQFPHIRKAVNHNIKFDIHMLRTVDILLNPNVCECTMIRAALINEHLHNYDLDSLAKRYLKKEKYNSIYEELAALFGGAPTKKAQVGNFPRAPISMMKRYAVPDTELAAELWQWQEKEILRQDLTQVWELERRLFPKIVRNEARGIRVSPEEAVRRSKLLEVKIAETQKELNELAGFEVNPNPSGSIAKLFNPQKRDGVWYANDGTPLSNTKAGKPSLGADALKAMKHPAAKLILKARKMKKAKDTFIEGHILGNQVNGYVHPNINQTKGDVQDDGGEEGTGTGRLSYTRPALQQIPSRDKETAALIRPIFLPDEGQKWTYGDLDQHEFRIFTHYAAPKALLQAYAENPDLDMHQIVSDMTGLPRSAPESGGANAKQINLAMVFNMGAGELASRMSLPYTLAECDFGTRANPDKRIIKQAGDEALEIMEKYYRAVPGVREVARQARSIAKSRGHVMTMYGRHLRFPGGLYTYKASGLIYQGTAADFNKKNVILIDDYLESECPHNRFLLNIHDEYSMSMVQDGNEARYLKDIQGLIEDKGLRVPIRIDFSQLADNWWDATKAPHIT